MRSMEPRSAKRPSIVTGSGTLRSSRPSSDRPKLNSKYAGVQLFGLGQLPDPDAQVAAERRDLVAPDALDRRRELLFVARRDARERALDHARSRRPTPAAVDRQPSVVACIARKNSRLHLVEERAARQRIEPLQRLRLLVRLRAGRWPRAANWYGQVANFCSADTE